tara:strand:- start:5329 stop:5691 length:363 start_codon:yes stop_codon:yes gene_type:complete
MRIDKKILKYLYQNKNDGSYHVLFERPAFEYEEIIGPIEDLMANGLIARAVNQTLSMYADPDPEFDHREINTKCKITQAGILYYEKTKETRSNKTLSVIALIISIGTLVFTVLDKLVFSK